MSKLLNALGLMTRAEHERLCDKRFESLENMIDSKNETIERAVADRNNWRGTAVDRLSMISDLSADRDDWEAKFKKATTDLAAQSVKAADLAAEVEALRPDALAMRRKRQMDRDRKGKKS